MANIQNNKSPGNDGLTKGLKKFMKAFEMKIKKYLSTQYKHQNISISQKLGI